MALASYEKPKEVSLSYERAKKLNRLIHFAILFLRRDFLESELNDFERDKYEKILNELADFGDELVAELEEIERG